MREITASIDEIFAEDMRDEEFLKASRQTRPHYDLVVDMINRRIELNISQKDLAKRARILPRRISRIESGDHDVKLSTIIKIAEALETEVSISLEPIKPLPQLNETNEQ